MLLCVVALAYQPVWFGSRLWDDDGHLIGQGLQSLSGLWRIWFHLGATQQYYSVVYSIFWLGARLWGEHYLGYHLVNIVLHATSAFIIIQLLRRMSVPGAALASLLFAVHPVQVESIAWMSELKNAMSGVCYLSSAWC